MDDYKNEKQRLGCAIASRREAKGVSQRMFAQFAGVDRSTLREIESGMGNPTLTTLLRLSHSLEVPIDVLLKDCWFLIQPFKIA